MFHQQFQTIWALRARTPSHRPLLRFIEEHFTGSLHDIALLLLAQIAGNFMMIAMSRHLVSLSDDRSNRVRVPFRDSTAGQKCCLNIVGRKDAKDSPDAGIGAVFSLSVLFMIDPAVFVRPNVLTTLEIKA